MLFLHALLALAFSTLIIAAPTPTASFVALDWLDSEVVSSLLDFGKRYPYGQSDAGSQAASCNVANAVASMPQAPTPLPSVAAGLTLYHVAIGRGTQNYTCDTATPSATPVQIGAVATLFNVTCLAADSPALLATLPGIALEMPTPSTSDDDTPAYQDMSGHHYFINPTTPYFNMDTAEASYGAGPFKKMNSSAAPADAIVGQNGVGDGAAPWLMLEADNSAGQVFQQIYRLNTAGGMAPSTCEGQDAAFEIQYAAEYWLFA